MQDGVFLKLLKIPLNNVMCSYLDAKDILNLVLCCKGFYEIFNELLDGVRKMYKTCPFYLNPFEHAVLGRNTFFMDAFFTPKRFTPSCCFHGVIERYRDQIDQRDLMFFLL